MTAEKAEYSVSYVAKLVAENAKLWQRLTRENTRVHLLRAALLTIASEDDRSIEDQSSSRWMRDVVRRALDEEGAL